MKLLQTPGIPFRLSDSTRHQLGLYALVAASIVAFGFLTVTNLLFAASTERVYSFSGADGAFPDAGLIRDASGSLYGITTGGGISTSNCFLGDYLGCGTVFQLTPGASGTWTETVLYEFTGSPDGSAPAGRLVSDKDGNLYGTTTAGGAPHHSCYGFGFGCGTVFQLKRAANGEWTEDVLHSFNGNDGSNPIASLIFDVDGNLYGTTSDGGLYGNGTVFELTPKARGGWKLTVLYHFSKVGKDGASPGAGLTFDAAGNLYGTTFLGGAYSEGAVFQLKRCKSNNWAEHVLHSFNANGDGYNPSGGLIFDKAGNLYGTTEKGGQAGAGTAYRLKSGANGKWAEEILYSFCSAVYCIDGSSPTGLSSDADGNLYGTAFTGGNTDYGLQAGYGTVFELAPDSNGTWIETVLHAFNQAGEDGTYPSSGVIFDSDGNLYGTTQEGSVSGVGCNGHGCGTVFEITR